MLENLDYYTTLFEYRTNLSYFRPFIENLWKKNKKIKKILVRVDDFPRWDKNIEEFYIFHNIMKKHEINYLLGVTPLLSKYPLDPSCRENLKIKQEEMKFLKKEKDKGNIEIALHGLTHQTTRKNFPTEFAELNEKETEEKIKQGIEILRKANIKTEIIIPPFNTFTLENIQAFKKHFKMVCGGLETIKILGRLPIGNLDGIIYIPSYPPYYLSRTPKFPLPKELVCLTIHWSWFKKEQIEKICKKIEEHTIRWDSNTLQTNIL